MKKKKISPLKKADLLAQRSAPLATPTDLGAKATKDIAAAINATTALLSTAENINTTASMQRVVTAMAADPGVVAVMMVAGHPGTVLASSRHTWQGRALAALDDPVLRTELQEVLARGGTRQHLDRATPSAYPSTARGEGVRHRSAPYVDQEHLRCRTSAHSQGTEAPSRPSPVSH